MPSLSSNSPIPYLPDQPPASYTLLNAPCLPYILPMHLLTHVTFHTTLPLRLPSRVPYLTCPVFWTPYSLTPPSTHLPNGPHAPYTLYNTPTFHKPYQHCNISPCLHLTDAPVFYLMMNTLFCRMCKYTLPTSHLTSSPLCVTPYQWAPRLLILPACNPSSNWVPTILCFYFSVASNTFHAPTVPLLIWLLSLLPYTL